MVGNLKVSAILPASPLDLSGAPLAVRFLRKAGWISLSESSSFKASWDDVLRSLFLAMVLSQNSTTHSIPSSNFVMHSSDRKLGALSKSSSSLSPTGDKCLLLLEPLVLWLILVLCQWNDNGDAPGYSQILPQDGFNGHCARTIRWSKQRNYLLDPCKKTVFNTNNAFFAECI